MKTIKIETARIGFKVNKYQLIKAQYENSRGDSTALFQAVLVVAEEVGLEAALGVLEQCVTEKRVAWIDDQFGSFPRSGFPVQDGFNIFFERYLGLSIPYPDLAFDEESGHWSIGEINWDEFWATIKGDGLLNRERVAHKVKAWDDGRWVRDGAEAHAAKNNRRMLESA